MRPVIRAFAPVAAILLAGFTPHPELPARGPADRAGSLGDNQIIQSESLGYDLQYRVYLPDGYDELEDLPVLFLTDGQWYIDQGETTRVLDELIESGAIEPTLAVFIDNRDPDRLNVNRRNNQFFCNPRYISFVTDELVSSIDTHYRTRATRESRVILGLSFGGLNSACFGLYAHETIGGIGMQSPAIHPVPDLVADYANNPAHPIKVFLSTGTVNDNLSATRRLKEVLEDKGYEMSYVEVPYGHDWSNWGPLMDDVLVYFFGN